MSRETLDKNEQKDQKHSQEESQKCSTIRCGDCGELLPINLECENPECVRVIMKTMRL